MTEQRPLQPVSLHCLPHTLPFAGLSLGSLLHPATFKPHSEGVWWYAHYMNLGGCHISLRSILPTVVLLWCCICCRGAIVTVTSRCYCMHVPLSVTPEHLLPFVYKVAVNASSAHLFPIETCPFGFPSRPLLMGAVVITACRPSGISGLILVPNSPGPGLSHVSALLSSQTQHGGIPSNH